MLLFFRCLGWSMSILSLANLCAIASHSDVDYKEQESHLLLPLMQQQSTNIQQMEEGYREGSSTIHQLSGNTISRVKGNVTLGDYFETNVYQNIEEPHKKLFEQMTIPTLQNLSRNPGLVLDFEVASRDFAETVGPGISSALYPTTLETYKRLANQSHPIALERYADHLIFAAQVKTDKDLIFNVCCLCCAKCSSNDMCKDAKSAYKDALKKYDPQSSHARLLKGKIEDVSVIANTINRQYCIRLSAYIIPPLITIGIIGGLAYTMISPPS